MGIEVPVEYRIVSKVVITSLFLGWAFKLQTE